MASKKSKRSIIVKPVLHIFCEGEKSEPIYLNNYIDNYYFDYKNIVVVEKTIKNTPIELVEEAVKAKQNLPTSDQFWVVFDREAINKRSHDIHKKARDKAQKHGINIALSCVCFEKWLLLHLKNTTASYPSCQELIKSADFKSLLSSFGISSYDKGSKLLFDKLRDKSFIDTAIINAKSINQSAIKADLSYENQPHYYNPYTDMYKLLEAIQAFCKNST